MKTKYTNLAILTFFSSVLTTENLLCICRAFYLLPLCFLSCQLLSFSVSSLVCLSFCGTTKKPRSLEPGGGWDLSFIHPCTLQVCGLGFFVHSSLHTLQVCGFSYSNSWNVVLLFSCCQLLDLICRFFFISGSVLWFTLASDQSKSGQCRHVDEELGRRRVVMAARHCRSWWRVWSVTLWATLMRSWLHSLSCYLELLLCRFLCNFIDLSVFPSPCTSHFLSWTHPSLNLSPCWKQWLRFQ